MSQRVSDISHHLCFCMACSCPGENGADTETALCFNLAKRLIEMSEADRRQLALAIAPELNPETLPPA